MDIQTKLSLVAIIISIFTLIFTVFVDLKSSIQSVIKQKHLNRLSDVYINKVLVLCYIKLHDENNEMRNLFDDNVGLFRLKETFFIEKLTQAINDLREIESRKMFFSEKLYKRIEILEIIRSISISYLNLTTLDEIIYHGTTAFNNTSALELLFQEVKNYKNILKNEHIWNIVDHWKYIKKL